jgi:hypothetical protein
MSRVGREASELRDVCNGLRILGERDWLPDLVARQVYRCWRDWGHDDWVRDVGHGSFQRLNWFSKVMRRCQASMSKGVAMRSGRGSTISKLGWLLMTVTGNPL